MVFRVDEKVLLKVSQDRRCPSALRESIRDLLLLLENRRHELMGRYIARVFMCAYEPLDDAYWSGHAGPDCELAEAVLDAVQYDGGWDG